MNIEDKEFSKAKSLKKRYDIIYKETFNTSFTGIHSTILHFLKPYLDNKKKVLDVGCGAGRLSIILSKFVGEIDSFDYSEKAIETAKIFAKHSQINNVNFSVSEIKNFYPGKKYDVITISEVIEHVDDPVSFLKRISNFLKEKGIMVVSCPNFENFKGGIYIALHKLFGLPMSLTDKRQVSIKNMVDWSSQSNLKILKTIGNCYDWGWLEKFYLDMKRRVPLNMRYNKPELLEFSNFKDFNEWMEKTIPTNKKFINFLFKKGSLQKREREYNLNLPEEISEEERLYLLDGDLKDNFYFCDQEPINFMGGDSIYILKKLDSKF